MAIRACVVAKDIYRSLLMGGEDFEVVESCLADNWLSAKTTFFPKAPE